MKTSVLVFWVLFISSLVKAKEYPVDLDEAHRYFNEIKKICDLDNGKLWGRNLWAPILIIDKKTRFIVANEADKEGKLQKNGSVYTGYFPENKVIANSTTEFGNKFWMMIMHPLPENEFVRNQLFIHELFHRLQRELKLESGSYNNDHMDNMDARILIKLEWLALEKAINNDDIAKQNSFLTDALVFKNYRRMLYPGKDSMENEFEIHEGLAEYTGHKLCSGNNEEFKTHVLQAKDKYWDIKTYVRSFAYYSGLLYGYILDLYDINWRINLKLKTDLGLLVQNNYNIKLPENLEAAYKISRNNYNYNAIQQFEENREIKKNEILNMYRLKFTEDTVLTLNIARPNVLFNPDNLIPLDTLGTVYPTIKIIDNWGILEVKSEGCLFDWSKAIVPAKNIKEESKKIIGKGWKLELNDNWKLIIEDSNYKLRKEE